MSVIGAGAHQLSTFSTPVNGTTPIDANVVRGNDNTIKTSYNAHDADVAIHVQSAAEASKPATGNVGAFFVATDTDAFYVFLDTAGGWVEIDYLRNTGGTVTGNVGVTGTLTVTSTSASALTVGRQGATDPVLKVNANTASVATGISITGAAAAGRVAVAAISSGTNEGLDINAKGSGSVRIANSSTGDVLIGGGGATNTVTIGSTGSTINIGASGSGNTINLNGTGFVTGALDAVSTLYGAGGLITGGVIASAAANTLFISRSLQTTVGAAGGASALPATPSQYLRVNHGGTHYVIPMYAQA